MGTPTTYAGIQISRTQHDTILHQQQYIERAMHKHNIPHKHYDTPLPVTHAMGKPQPPTTRLNAEETSHFYSILGTTAYTRQSNGDYDTNQEDWTTHTHPTLQLYTDSSQANLPDAKTTLGYIILYRGNIVAWGSYKSKSTQYPSTESEYVAGMLPL
eukprot:Pgem_evm1s7872